MRRPEELDVVALLHEMGLTCTQIARIAHLPRTTVWNWLNGRVPTVAVPGEPTCRGCGHPRHRIEPSRQPSYTYLLGVYLGDGHVAPFPRTTCLRLYLDSRYPNIIGACVAALRALLPRNSARVFRKGDANCVAVCCYSKQWPCLLPQSGPGPKHERPIVLADWQRDITRRHPEALIRGLIHSDGSRYLNPIRRGDRSYTYSSYNFSNVSEDIKAIFCEHLGLLGVAWRRNGPKEIAITQRAAVAQLDEFVGPKR